MKVPPPEIIGEHIKLRPVRNEDFDGVFRYASDPEVCRYMVWGPSSQKESEDHMNEIMKRYQLGDAQDVDWSIERLSDGQFLGKCSLYGENEDSVEVGYVLDREYWGMGYGTELVRLLIRSAIEDYGFQKVRGTCHVDNLSSARVMEKAGMIFVGVAKNLEVQQGVQRDSKVFEITAESM